MTDTQGLGLTRADQSEEAGMVMGLFQPVPEQCEPDRLQERRGPSLPQQARALRSLSELGRQLPLEVQCVQASEVAWSTWVLG